MPHHEYLIIGGGMTGDAAARGIRSVDADGSVGILGEEPHPPYERPPLTKGLWKGMEPERIWRGTGDLDVVLHTGRRAVRLDPQDRTVTDDRGVIYSYEKLLLATGGTPRRLEDAVSQVVYLRTLDDFRALRKRAEEKRRFTVVGGGFIGTEVAAVLAEAGKQVTMVFPEEGIGRAVFTPEQSEFLNGYFADRGVDVRPGVEVASVRRSGDRFLLALRLDGDRTETLRAHGVVAGLGIQPNVALGEAAGVEVEDGIVVDRTLRTSDPHIWAAGDVASIWSPPLGRRIRVEHEDQANRSGEHAGRCMAGEVEDYDHLPFFYSDFFDLSYEAVGTPDPSLDVASDWVEPGTKGVEYYVSNGRVRGVLLWNLPGRLKEARALVREGERRRDAEAWKGAISTG